jgi:hypothetical protein
MNVKGTVYLTGKTAIIALFSEERWNSFKTTLAAKDKFFSNMIMPVTLIPMDKFILYLDELIKEFFNNDKSAYWIFGMTASKFALSPGGPYNSYLLTKDIKQFVESVMPRIWSTYFDGGIVTSRFENNIAHVKMTGITIKDYYFEQLIMGFFYQALRVFGKKNTAKRVKSLSAGDEETYYQFELKES